MNFTKRNNIYHIVNYSTKKQVFPDNFVFTGENDPWEIIMNLDAVKNMLNLDHFRISPSGFSKYLPFMPININSNFVSLNEAATPLIKSRVLGEQLGVELYFKVEGKNPTGSFKDRGSIVELSIAKEFCAKGIILASTGNMAASCACYAALAKIPCYVLIPEGVSLSKLAQVTAFGGRIVQIKGNYNDAAKLAKIIAIKMGYYLAGNYAYRVEGQKTAAFEIADQLNFQTPDLVVLPIGCGTNIAAYLKGFNEYHHLGLLNKIPQLIGVQAEGSSPVIQSYLKCQNIIKPLENIATLASAIAIGNPIDGIKALNAMYSTNGYGVSVTDEEIIKAQYLLSTQEGLFTETASAATLAAIIKTVKDGNYLNKKIICILTGDGLKDVNLSLISANDIPTIYPNEKEFYELFKMRFKESEVTRY